jgi:ABC-type polysaccharide/polyol phosphate export permease
MSFILGLASSTSLGIIFAGFVLVTARHATLLAEGIGGAFLLLCGVIYPIDMLPSFWQSFALGIPLTYWIESTRRAFGLAPFGQTMVGWSDNELMLALFGFATLFAAGAVVLFNFFSNTAKKYGKIDQTTHY